LFYIQAYKTSSRCSNDSGENLVKFFELSDLDSGTYEVRDYKNLKKWTAIRMNRGRIEEQDSQNAVLARVDTFEVQKDNLGFRRIFRLSGLLPEGCYTAHEGDLPKVRKLSGNVIEIVPTVETVKKSPHCISHGKPQPYQRSFEAPNGIASGRYLFRIPSSNGQLIHRIASIENDTHKVTIEDSRRRSAL
jgi:hypothetical protein